MGFCCKRIVRGFRRIAIGDISLCCRARFPDAIFSIIHVISLTHPTRLHGWIASTYNHPSDCVLVLLVVTRGEYVIWELSFF